jgi:MYXO-CTERM domain-containing protein
MPMAQHTHLPRALRDRETQGGQKCQTVWSAVRAGAVAAARWVALGCVTTGMAAAASAAPQAAWVLPAGQETAVLGALGDETPLAGCRRQDVRIAATAIEVVWRCADGLQHSRLVYSRESPAGVALAADSTVTAALREALAARLAAAPVAVQWQMPAAAVQPSGGAAAPAAASLPSTATRVAAPLAAAATPATGHGWPAAVEQLYNETEALLRNGRTWTRLDALRAAAAQVPDSLILGRLVVAAAERVGQPDGPAWVDGLLAQSDSQRADPVLQFVAGVAVHYRGHTRGTSLQAKQADYRHCIARLERVRDTYAHNARLWLYLAVSYLRTGQHLAAREAIDRSVAADAGSDADVYYCRAEVWHRVDTRRALADIARYQQLMASNRARGAWSAPGKEERVARMRAVLQDVVDGRAQLPPPDQDLFDPLLQLELREPPSPWPKVVGAMALLAGVAAAVMRRRRSR